MIGLHAWKCRHSPTAMAVWLFGALLPAMAVGFEPLVDFNINGTAFGAFSSNWDNTCECPTICPVFVVVALNFLNSTMAIIDGTTFVEPENKEGHGRFSCSFKSTKLPACIRAEILVFGKSFCDCTQNSSSLVEIYELFILNPAEKQSGASKLRGQSGSYKSSPFFIVNYTITSPLTLATTTSAPVSLPTAAPSCPVEAWEIALFVILGVACPAAFFFACILLQCWRKSKGQGETLRAKAQEQDDVIETLSGRIAAKEEQRKDEAEEAERLVRKLRAIISENDSQLKKANATINELQRQQRILEEKNGVSCDQLAGPLLHRPVAKTVDQDFSGSPGLPLGVPPWAQSARKTSTASIDSGPFVKEETEDCEYSWGPDYTDPMQFNQRNQELPDCTGFLPSS